MQSFGISEEDADTYERELVKGKIIVLTWHNDTATIERSGSLRRDAGVDPYLTRPAARNP